MLNYIDPTVFFFSLPGSYWHYRADCDSTPQQPSHNRAFLHLPLGSYLPSCPWCKYCLRKLSLPIFLRSCTVIFFLKFWHTDLKWCFYGNCVYVIDNGMNLNIAKALLLQCLHLCNFSVVNTRSTLPFRTVFLLSMSRKEVMLGGKFGEASRFLQKTPTWDHSCQVFLSHLTQDFPY